MNQGNTKRIYLSDLDDKNTLEELRRQYLQDPFSLLDMNQEEAEIVADKIIQFYRDHAKSANMNGYVIGISGGMDSAVVAALAVRAVGKENVFGALLPSKSNTPQDIACALEVVAQLGLRHNDFEQVRTNFNGLVEQVRKLGERHTEEAREKVKIGNIHARLRMILLRDFAPAKGCLVAGTTNLSEDKTGYSTIAGDGLGGIDNEGIIGLHKTTVKKFARYLGVPQSILAKAPSAGLWEGQTDESDLGITYENLDLILAGMQLGLSDKQIIAANKRKEIDEAAIARIRSRVDRNRFKSQLPPAPVLGVCL